VDFILAISVFSVDTTVGGLRDIFVHWLTDGISCILLYVAAFILCCWSINHNDYILVISTMLMFDVYSYLSFHGNWYTALATLIMSCMHTAGYCVYTHLNRCMDLDSKHLLDNLNRRGTSCCPSQSCSCVWLQDTGSSGTLSEVLCHWDKHLQ
jgi:hypothetical protein